MAYTEPTAADLIARFPVFCAVDKSVIDQALLEAKAMVDETWAEEEFALARMLFAAHAMTCDGLGNTPEARAVRGDAQVKSQSAADHKIEFAVTTPTAATISLEASDLASTAFGRRFRTILARNAGGPLVIGGGGTYAPFHPNAQDWSQ